MPLWRALKVYGSSRLGINTKKVDMLIETQEELLKLITMHSTQKNATEIDDVLR